MYICVDFDGTCVKHEYPLVGSEIGAIPVLKELVLNKHKLILFTMRSGKELKDAEQWFVDNDIKLYASQKNPTQSRWTRSPKCYGQLYIDDAALGCPLIIEDDEQGYVNWDKVKELLVNNGTL